MGYHEAVEPWASWFSFLVGPLVLLVQAGALFVRRPIVRRAITLGCVAALLVMVAVVVSYERAHADGFDWGSPYLVFELLVSLVLLVAALAREAVGRLVTGRPPPRGGA